MDDPYPGHRKFAAAIVSLFFYRNYLRDVLTDWGVEDD